MSVLHAHPAPIPARAGIGLRAPHYRRLLDELPACGFLEVHSENYFGAGGQALHFLEKLRAHYPLSLHGVGLSLGSADTLNLEHLGKVKKLAARFAPSLISEHLCWTSINGRHMNDLLPLPYTEEALAHVSTHIMQTQDFLGQRILIENVSSYLQFTDSTIPEWEFVAAVAQHTGCGILLDVNNIYVNSLNHGFNPLNYLHAIPPQSVGEIHLAGFDFNVDNGIAIDTHGQPVSDEVWTLYRAAIEHCGAVPTLIEWDTNIPELKVLLGEAAKADVIRAAVRVEKIDASFNKPSFPRRRESRAY
jgi:uncharacterized protein